MNEAANTVVPAPQEIKLTPAQEARFWAKVNKAGPTQAHMESPCWLWTAGKIRDGYGRFKVKGKTMGSHRVAYILANGSIAEGLCILHICDLPACVRVSHLRSGTNAENSADMVAKKRQAKGKRNGSYTKPESRPRGDRNGARLHPERLARGEANRRSKLTDAKVIDIRTQYSRGGITLKQLAVQFGVSLSLIGYVVTRAIWRHIP